MFPLGVHLTGGRNAAATHREAAREFYAPIIPIVVELRRQGLSLRAIARELDRRGFKTRLAYPDQRWNATQVRRVLARVAKDGQHKKEPMADAPPGRPATRFSCPHCARSFEGGADYAGRAVGCPICGRIFRVPDADPGRG